MKKQKLKSLIVQVLETTPEARNSDQYLSLCIWNRYYPELIFKNEKGETSATFNNIMQLPREYNIKRIRAIIQNVDHKFLPTNIEVVIKRKINQELWKNYIKNQEYE